jgi:TRAP-type C4-dicarboxylate transport system permease small subunit
MQVQPKYSVEGVIATILFLFLVAVVMIQILGRTPILRGPVWTEEAARWIWVWMAFIAIGEVERQNKHLRMAFLAEKLPGMLRKIVFTGIDLVYLGITGHLCWIGYKTVERTWAHSSVTLPVPNATLYASAFIASFFIIYRIIRRIASGRSGETDGIQAL